MRDRTYGQFQTVYATYVIPESYSLGTGETIQLSVINAAPIDGDISASSAVVWEAIEATDGFAPLSIDWDYGAEPIPGRKMPPADLARIDVTTDERMGIDADYHT